MALSISTLKREEDNVMIFSLKGSLDTETHESLKSKVQEYINPSTNAIFLDLKNLDYISSMGISAIIDLRKAAKEKGIKLLMVNVPMHIEQVFKIIKALPEGGVFENVSEADRYLMEMQKKAKEKKDC